MSAANALAFIRASLAVPIATIVILQPTADPLYFVALSLFVTAVATDVLDGALARRNGATPLGAALDPAADAVLVLAVLGPFATRVAGLAPVVFLLLLRDALILSLRARLAARGVALPASPLAKLKVAFLFAGCASLLLAMAAWISVLPAIAFGLIYAGAVASLLSAIQYAARARMRRA